MLKTKDKKEVREGDILFNDNCGGYARITWLRGFGDAVADFFDYDDDGREIYECSGILTACDLKHSYILWMRGDEQ